MRFGRRSSQEAGREIDRRVLQERCEPKREARGFKDVVRCKETDVRSRAEPERDVERVVLPAFRDRYQLDAMIATAPIGENHRGLIRRSVFYRDEFPIRVGLFDDTLNCLI